jgi:hypothetical protein
MSLRAPCGGAGSLTPAGTARERFAISFGEAIMAKRILFLPVESFSFFPLTIQEETRYVTARGNVSMSRYIAARHRHKLRIGG